MGLTVDQQNLLLELKFEYGGDITIDQVLNINTSIDKCKLQFKLIDKHKNLFLTASCTIREALIKYFNIYTYESSDAEIDSSDLNKHALKSIEDVLGEYTEYITNNIFTDFDSERYNLSVGNEVLLDWDKLNDYIKTLYVHDDLTMNTFTKFAGSSINDISDKEEMEEFENYD